MLQEYSDAIEADFHRFYQLDLLDLYRGTLSPRKVLVLIEHLPPGAALWNETGGDSAWTLETHLLANVLDAVNVSNWIAAGGKQSSKPKPIARPDELLKKRKHHEAIEANLKRFKGKHPK